MSVDSNVGVKLFATTLADKHMAIVLPNHMLGMNWQRLEIHVTDFTVEANRDQGARHCARCR